MYVYMYMYLYMYMKMYMYMYMYMCMCMYMCMHMYMYMYMCMYTAYLAASCSDNILVLSLQLLPNLSQTELYLCISDLVLVAHVHEACFLMVWQS